MNITDTQTYQFRIAGHLDDHWSAVFENLTLARQGDGTSTLTGPLADQAQLHGILATLRDIGATIVSVQAVDVSPAMNPRHRNPGC
jgi:hypothetical protein